jgi:hypothetical protein
MPEAERKGISTQGKADVRAKGGEERSGGQRSQLLVGYEV